MAEEFINIHTHHPQGNSLNSIVNIAISKDEIPLKGPFSAGLHPWYLDAEHFPAQIKQLAFLAQRKDMLAIGECGLDKHVKVDFQLQLTVFSAQIALANSCNKPLIIHCVKAYTECVRALKEAQVPVIFHGFNKHAQLGLSLLRAGYKLSFGVYILRGTMDRLLEVTPLEQMFLETDTKLCEIEILYSYVAKLRGISVTELQQAIKQNFNAMFLLR